ncbi:MULTISPECIES: hypothetical protein [Rhizobium]|nr:MULTISPECIES: hypothetical protein [Rhizobium]
MSTDWSQTMLSIISAGSMTHHASSNARSAGRAERVEVLVRRDEF